MKELIDRLRCFFGIHTFELKGTHRNHWNAYTEYYHCRYCELYKRKFVQCDKRGRIL